MFINPHLLSEPELYKFLCGHLSALFRGYVTLDLKSIKKITYASWHRRYPHQIDQIFHSHWHNLEQRMSQHSSLSLALLDQVSRYHLDEDPRRIAVKMDRFDAWQNWLANQSGLPVIAYQANSRCPSDKRLFADFQLRDWLKEQLGYRSLICPYSPMIEDYIQHHGLNECHMHLNGTTTLEAMWHFALCHPAPILQDLESEFDEKPRVQLLYAATPQFSHPKHYQQLLILARHLRQLLLAWVKQDPKLAGYRHKVHLLLDPHAEQKHPENECEHQAQGFELEKEYFGQADQWTHITELSLHIQIIDKLKSETSQQIDTCYLLYLLCLNCFQRLMVQRDDQYGFDQFQKFADDGIRELYENDYQNRFFQLHGPNHIGKADLLSLEGRFAPKKTPVKNNQLLERILRGFLHYHGNRQTFDDSADLNALAKQVSKKNRPTLRLVAHFIKQPWSRKETPHFGQLRQTLRQNGEALLDVLNEAPALRTIITGIDAAANELETPPEVFAVLFRHFRRKGMKHFTYHVGEDFEHLLSGIRAIYEAVEFLDLRNGDRIGHATAIGVHPKHWLDKMPESLFLTQGQWLENMLFLRQMALQEPLLSPKLSLAHIEANIQQLAYEIFHEVIDLNILQQFFLHRDLDPELVLQFKQNPEGLALTMRDEEYQRILKIPEPREVIITRLHQRWFDSKVIERYYLKKEFLLKETPVELLLAAQQYVQRLIVERHVVLETLPTSNVRISYYQHIYEHHIFRWLGIEGNSLPGDSPMTVVLGSDDPGIFATDMRNEFYHLVSALVTYFGYSEAHALDIIAKINEQGRIYQFNF